MKNSIKILGVVSLLLILVFAVYIPSNNIDYVSAQADIVVVGEGSVTATPNMATINMSLETRNEDLNLAVQENKEKTDNILSVLTSLGFKNEDIKTKNFSVYQRFDYGNKEEFLGYQVRTSFQVETKDLNGLRTLIDQLTQSGANYIEGITFSCDNENELYQEAIKLALDNAKIKAGALSNASLEIKKITEEYCYVNNLYRDCYSYVANQKDISNGTIKVMAKVIVEFTATV